MKKNQYVHADLHTRNIAYTKTDKKYIKLENTKVRTHGYIYSAIDYGKVIHPKFKGLTEWDLNKLNNELCDINSVMNTLLPGRNLGIWDLIKHGKFVNHKKVNDKIRKSKEYKILNNIYKFNNDNDRDILLFKGIYPKLYLKLSGVKKMKPHYKKRMVSVNDYIFIWENMTNLKKIIDYFVEKSN